MTWTRTSQGKREYEEKVQEQASAGSGYCRLGSRFSSAVYDLHGCITYLVDWTVGQLGVIDLLFDFEV